MKTLEPINSSKKIKVRKDGIPTEFEVQARLYTALLAFGFDVRGEVCCKDSDMQCRFDLVMFDGDEPFHIAEVKAAPIKHRKSLEDTRQGRRYRLFGVPVTFIYGMGDVDEFVRLMNQTMNLRRAA